MFISMFLIQVFVMPYVMTERPEHVYFTPSQAYMGVFMGACMVGVEGIMHPMPWWGWLLTVVLAVGAVVGYRLQLGISDRNWMREMIPHHSMALLTSAKRTQSLDPFVHRLAETIITAQRREINEMKVQLATLDPRSS
jgi:hypothetical protein